MGPLRPLKRIRVEIICADTLIVLRKFEQSIPTMTGNNKKRPMIMKKYE